MKYPEFKLETYLATREFNDPLNLCASDLESFSMTEILEMADEASLQLWNNLALHYTEPKGLPLLREQICLQYSAKITADHILCFAGAEEGIYSMAHAILSPPDHAIVVTPCYQSLESVAATICSTTAVQLQYGDRWELNLDDIASAIQPNTKLIVINFPHNPTGATITQEQQAALIELARRHGIWIFSDEVYRHLELDPSDRLPPFASAYEKGLSLGVMSKAYGLPGLRVGWIACQDKRLLQEMGEVKHYLSICNSAPSEILSLIALRAGDRILDRNHRIMKDNLALLSRFFEEQHEWFEWVPPKGGCIGYPLFKGTLSISTLADELLKSSNVLILPSSVYNHSGNHFRISFGRSNMSETLTQFTNFIDQNKGNWKTRV